MDYTTHLAERVTLIEASGIRKIFDMAATIKDAIDLSIGQPDFEVPEPVRKAAIEAIDGPYNRYPPSVGWPDLRNAVLDRYQRVHGVRPDDVIITCGTSGGLTLGLLGLVNPGDEVLIPDPFFVSYKHLTTMCGGKGVFYNTYPHFSPDVAEIEKLISPRTKVIMLMSPGNPTGGVWTDKQKRDLADLARAKNVIVLSDEVYDLFVYGEPQRSMVAHYKEGTLSVGGFSKTLSIPGWRLGWIAGPKELIQQMTKLQQFTFVAAPNPIQRAVMKGFDVDLSGHVTAYRKKRDFLVQGLRQAGYECEEPGGAFYVFPRVPAKYKNAQEFAETAITKRMLLVPGNSFSQRDTHFRISYGATDKVLAEAMEVFKALA
jgi:aspartate aminotransferase/aminotransferase